MALLDFDSYDYYQTANLAEVYSAVDNGGNFGPTGSAQIVTGFGRCNTNCLKVTPTPALSGPLWGVPASGSRVIIGSAVNCGTGTPILFQIRYGNTALLNINRAPDGAIVGHLSPGAPFAPDSFVSFGGLLQANAWHYVGLDILLGSGSSGAVTIEIDGVVRQVITGIDTSDRGTGWTGVGFGGRNFSAGNTVYFDDSYLMDATGPAPWNALLGDVHVQRLRPTAPGLTGFTVTGAPTNWQAEDDNDHPDKSSYVSANTAGVIDTYEYEDIANVAGSVVYGVKESALCYKDFPGSRTLEFATRNGGVLHLEGTPLGIPAGVGNWAYIKRVMEQDPTTGAQFTPAGVNSNQYGMDLIT